MPPALRNGWGPSTPRDDTLARAYIEAYADLCEALGRAGGHRTLRTKELVAFDSHVPFPFFNVAVPLRPIVDDRDPLLDEIGAFFAGDDDTPFLVYSATPLPSLDDRGWVLMGHPPFMLRPPSPATPPAPEGFEIVEVSDEATLDVFDRTMVDAYPVSELRGRRNFAPAMLEIPGWRLWLGRLDGEPVATAAAYVAPTHVDVEWVSTMASARGRRIGEAITWAATLAATDRPALLIASDLGQPVYARMGYLPVSRFSLWIGRRARAV
jgi:hypothetical protein